MELTPRQKSVFEVLCAYYRQHGYSPTVREIGDRLGLAGPAGVHRLLKILEEKGYIHSEVGKKRSWRPVERKIEPFFMPVAGEIAAGRPLDIWDHPDERLPLDPLLYGHENCFAVRVRGDSMTGMHIRDGDLAVIRPQLTVETGEIAAVLVEGTLLEATLKIVRKEWNLLELKAANPAYPLLRFQGRARERVRIVGKYVGLIRREK